MGKTLELPIPQAPGAREAARSGSGWGKGPAAPEVDRFLSGPQSRGFELRQAVQIFVEMLRGFRALHFVGPCVTVFGSARFTEDQPYYQLAREAGISNSCAIGSSPKAQSMSKISSAFS